MKVLAALLALAPFAALAHPTLPSFLEGVTPLKAQVKLRISKTGELLETSIVSSSGNDSFDSAVLATLKEAAPYLCPPPDHLLEAVQKQGIVLEFTP
jgi:TonB family protein